MGRGVAGLLAVAGFVSRSPLYLLAPWPRRVNALLTPSELRVPTYKQVNASATITPRMNRRRSASQHTGQRGLDGLDGLDGMVSPRRRNLSAKRSAYCRLRAPVGTLLIENSTPPHCRYSEGQENVQTVAIDALPRRRSR